MKKFAAYIDFTDDDEVFYVGKGNEGRCLNPYHNWLHEIVREEEGFNRAIVFESENEQECFDKEIELIAEYHTFFLDPLRSENACNFTLGGDGTSGRVMSDDGKKAIGNSHRGKPKSIEHRMRISNSLKGRKLSDDVRKKMSDAKKGKPLSPEHCKNLWKNRSHEFSLTHRENIGKASRGKPQSTISIQKRSIALRGLVHECGNCGQSGHTRPTCGRNTNVD